MDNKMILFGCGKIGYEALEFLGSENVECFCDNNPKVIGKEMFGKTVISFDELKSKYKDAIIMICADYRHSCQISKQCEDNGVLDYLYYIFVSGKFANRTETIAYLDDALNRMELRKYTYMLKIDELTRQVKYLEKHIDMCDLKPARGKFRERQLYIVQTAADFLDKVSGLEIKPFLYGGNLLGYVRHNGFIPWDDDIDFGIMRKDYEKLKEYCRRHLYMEEEFFNEEETGRDAKDIPVGMGNYSWKNLGDLIRVTKVFADGGRIEVDFFPLDCYAEDYSYDELMDFVVKVKERLAAVAATEQKIDVLEKALIENSKNIVEESEHIYFGIDSMDIVQQFQCGHWIPRKDLFPLKQVSYEGYAFWIPNNPEEFVKHEYGNIWEFPDDIGLPRHVALDEEEE